MHEITPIIRRQLGILHNLIKKQTLSIMRRIRNTITSTIGSAFIKTAIEIGPCGLLDRFVVETWDFGVACDAAQGIAGYVCWGDVSEGEGEGRKREDKLSPGGGGVMNVGVGVPWGGRAAAADTLEVRAMLAQRMRVLSCMAAVVRLEEAARELRCMELEMGLNVCLPSEPKNSKKHSIYPLPSHFCFSRSTQETGFHIIRLESNRRRFNETVMTMKQI
jgi:hypothetical protein